MTYRTYPLIEVMWDDAATDAQGWEDPDELDGVKVDRVMTVGFLVKESEAGLLIASTVCAEDTCNSRITIPRKMVVSIRYLRGKPKASHDKSNHHNHLTRPAVLGRKPDPTPESVSESGSGAVRDLSGSDPA